MVGSKAYFLPIIVFAILVSFLAYRLELINRGNAPNLIPSVMMGRQMPVFTLPPVANGVRELASADLKGKIVLIDIFASWCVQCLIEHPVLAKVKAAGIILAGIDYKDKPEDARAWLAKHGNPYDMIGADSDGHVAIDFGVYGAPESYLVDKQGIIRFKQTGPLTDEIIQNTVIPLSRELSK